ncbi:hypothetical protein H5S09_02800 [Limosilactobacillus sp. STM2_1]|uniref:Uncharacterized protein n=1 Tax=Limosilactobacillus rudii TaxID=2759755 RepID=A0A7W3UJX7_9LACO|nr:hypothetical protein [Limosilactobacillus rudii]MBB1080217.1 hypothetical protein [Limosilactobacillus rudii]MBB1096879.1 hypothetical protein [Limosilactobacillus rudii]MCD7133777.1 hypothetical protein [Limosilactobacillus rudii]
MKINELGNRIRAINTLIGAHERLSMILISWNGLSVVEVPYRAKNMFDCKFITDSYLQLPDDIKAQLAGIIGKFLRTPVKDRFPEKKYRLRWIDDIKGCKNYLNINDGVWGFNPIGFIPTALTESELEQLKHDNPRLAPAIDAMKELVEGEDDK